MKIIRFTFSKYITSITFVVLGYVALCHYKNEEPPNIKELPAGWEKRLFFSVFVCGIYAWFSGGWVAYASGNTL